MGSSESGLEVFYAKLLTCDSVVVLFGGGGGAFSSRGAFAWMEALRIFAFLTAHLKFPLRSIQNGRNADTTYYTYKWSDLVAIAGTA